MNPGECSLDRNAKNIKAEYLIEMSALAITGCLPDQARRARRDGIRNGMATILEEATAYPGTLILGDRAPLIGPPDRFVVELAQKIPRLLPRHG